MTRQIVRSHKRIVRTHARGATESERLIGRDSALALLTRSIEFGHSRLAVLRLAMAADVGAEVPPAYWSYCSRVALASKDGALQEIYRSAARKVAGLA